MADTRKPLAAKVALVTGGSRGIGAAVCQRLAAAGAHITLTYVQSADAANSVAEACRKHGGKAVVAHVDAGDVAAGQQLVNQMVADAGRIDILVNNAATLTLGDLLNVTPEMFDRYVAVNLRGVFLAHPGCGTAHALWRSHHQHRQCLWRGCADSRSGFVRHGEVCPGGIDARLGT
jgi:3-oxoacyl-[acyl-carrier protein] reductase